jgi:hypothetical protein
MKPIEEVIKAVEESKEEQLPSSVGYDVIMYLEMLRDLMSDTSHYFFRYAGENLKPRRWNDE